MCVTIKKRNLHSEQQQKSVQKRSEEVKCKKVKDVAFNLRATMMSQI